MQRCQVHDQDIVQSDGKHFNLLTEQEEESWRQFLFVESVPYRQEEFEHLPFCGRLSVGIQNNINCLRTEPARSWREAGDNNVCGAISLQIRVNIALPHLSVCMEQEQNKHQLSFLPPSLQSVTKSSEPEKASTCPPQTRTPRGCAISSCPPRPR